ncbi:MAG: gfo 3 [Planctomycetaceae bacterium]|nr:gfo 3 [Planctomycetaceae bacterium]
MPQTSKRKVRFAVVGLGHFAQAAILPAFANTSQAVELAALVTGDKVKATKLGRKYKTPAVNYDEYDSLCSSGDIDAVYIALPNSQHCEYTERAAHSGIHVLCEKPLAYSVDDAERMVAACEAANVRLMTAYRLHFEAGNLQAIKSIQSGEIGEARLFVSVHTMQVDPDNIRVDSSLGGGPVEDIGIYCLNAARYIFRAEPEEVTAFSIYGSDARFQEVPESVSATLRFPDDRLATFLCGFGEAKVSEYRIIGTKGVLKMDPAFTWQGDITRTISVGKNERTKTFKHRDQVAAEIDYFAKCIVGETEPEPSGIEGLIDVKIIDAIRASYRTQKSVRIKGLPSERRPKPSQSIRKKPPLKSELVKASPPAKDR